ncbi:unnamed protein product [Cuscuta europaea]|uniref:Uncharacterized protein n=1 Tax=Cuscuta europaea TaxID=41803 RepID=A0A9P0YKX9_CUSEU|nr:unnamed protein product [Cuscuta europaea]
MSCRDLAIWRSNKVKHAMDLLLAIPAEGLGQTISPRQFTVILAYRLDIPLFQDGATCSCCLGSMDTWGDHALRCSSLIGPNFRHNLVRDTVVDICFSCWYSSRN